MDYEKVDEDEEMIDKEEPHDALLEDEEEEEDPEEPDYESEDAEPQIPPQ